MKSSNPSSEFRKIKLMSKVVLLHIFALFQYMAIPFFRFEFISLIVPCLLMRYCTDLYGKPPSCIPCDPAASLELRPAHHYSC